MTLARAVLLPLQCSPIRPNRCMPSRIHRLPSVLVDRIAAGEVVDRPASVIKELVENSLDAGADHIIVETTAGGLDSILIIDNGSGISFDQLPLAIERHATSKITDLRDLEQILTYGFRGEALAAIASVSYLELHSSAANSGEGGKIRSRGGQLQGHEPAAPIQGTSVLVQELFYATPARKKFLKSQKAEDIAVHREILRLALARPGVHIEYRRDGKDVLNVPAETDLLSRISRIYGPEFAAQLLPVHEQRDSLTLSGFIGNDRTYRTQTDRQFTTVNHRPVEIRNLSFFVRKSYGELMPEGGRPAFVLNLQVDTERVDVNVHPAKREVRLTDEALLHNLVLTACQRALFPEEPLPFLQSAPTSWKGNRPFPSISESPENTRQGRPQERASPLLYPLDEVLGAASTVRDAHATEIHSSPQSGEAEAVLPVRDDASFPAAADRFLPRRHYGVIFGTYILAEGDDEFYFIDQHTAHERVNYEKKRRELEERRFTRQLLLHPIALHFDRTEIDSILEVAGSLADAGFVIESLGPEQLVLREAPDFLEPGEEVDVVKRTIQRLSEGEDLVRVYDEYAARKACRASIKKNDRIAPALISEILRDLARCEQPSRCPHGRPTILRLTRSELDQMFLRTGFAKRIEERFPA